MKKTSVILGTFALINSIAAQSLGGSGSSIFLKNSSGNTLPVNFGIGTDAPSNKLHIVGNEATGGRTYINLHNTNDEFNSSVGIRMSASNDVSTIASMGFNGYTYTNVPNFSEAFNIFTNGKSINLWNNQSTGITRIIFGTDASNQPLEVARFSSAGLAIGTSTPSAKLHTKGTVKMQELSVGSSFILTADADGNILKSTTFLTELNTKIADLTTRLTTAEEEIKILKKKVGLAAPAVINLVKLDQNQPNPVSNSTVIKFYTPELVQKAAIFLFDLNGRMVQQFNLNNVSGNQEFTINANTLEAGMYFYTLFLDGKEIDTKKMVITK